MVVQGTSGTGEEAIRYGWNYAKLLADGPSEAALVKTPVMRAMAALGRAGVAVDPSKVSLAFGGVPMVRRGVGLGLRAERIIGRVFRRKEFTITVGLGHGSYRAHLWTTDLSYDYVRINASYRS